MDGGCRRGVWGYCLTGTEFEFLQNERNSEDRLYHRVLNTTEHFKVVMMVNSVLCVFYHILKNENTRLLARSRATEMVFHCW